MAKRRKSCDKGTLSVNDWSLNVAKGFEKILSEKGLKWHKKDIRKTILVTKFKSEDAIDASSLYTLEFNAMESIAIMVSPLFNVGWRTTIMSPTTIQISCSFATKYYQLFNKYDIVSQKWSYGRSKGINHTARLLVSATAEDNVTKNTHLSRIIPNLDENGKFITSESKIGSCDVKSYPNRMSWAKVENLVDEIVNMTKEFSIASDLDGFLDMTKLMHSSEFIECGEVLHTGYKSNNYSSFGKDQNGVLVKNVRDAYGFNNNETRSRYSIIGGSEIKFDTENETYKNVFYTVSRTLNKDEHSFLTADTVTKLDLNEIIKSWREFVKKYNSEDDYIEIKNLDCICRSRYLNIFGSIINNSPDMVEPTNIVLYATMQMNDRNKMITRLYAEFKDAITGETRIVHFKDGDVNNDFIEFSTYIALKDNTRIVTPEEIKDFSSKIKDIFKEFSTYTSVTTIVE